MEDIHGVIQGTVPQLRARGSAMLRWSACFYERHGPDGAPCGLPWVTRTLHDYDLLGMVARLVGKRGS